MTPYHLARECERIRVDLREIADWVEGVAHPEVHAALIKVTGRIQGVEDHLIDLSAGATIRSELEKLGLKSRYSLGDDNSGGYGS